MAWLLYSAGVPVSAEQGLAVRRIEGWPLRTREQVQACSGLLVLWVLGEVAVDLL